RAVERLGVEQRLHLDAADVQHVDGALLLARFRYDLGDVGGTIADDDAHGDSVARLEVLAGVAPELFAPPSVERESRLALGSLDHLAPGHGEIARTGGKCPPAHRRGRDRRYQERPSLHLSPPLQGCYANTILSSAQMRITACQTPMTGIR